MTQKNNNENPTIADVLEAVNEASTKTEKRFQGIDTRLDGIDGRLDKIESTMVTKDFLEDKLADLKGDIIVELRSEDRKLATLVEVLRTRQVITEADAKQILSMKPFP